MELTMKYYCTAIKADETSLAALAIEAKEGRLEPTIFQKGFNLSRGSGCLRWANYMCSGGLGYSARDVVAHL